MFVLPGGASFLVAWLAAVPCAFACVVFTLLAALSKTPELKRRSGHRAVMSLGLTALLGFGAIPIFSSLSRETAVAIEQRFELSAFVLTLLAAGAIARRRADILG